MGKPVFLMPYVVSAVVTTFARDFLGTIGIAAFNLLATAVAMSMPRANGRRATAGIIVYDTALIWSASLAFTTPVPWSKAAAVVAGLLALAGIAVGEQRRRNSASDPA